MGKIIVNLDVEMAKRKISLGELSERVGLTQANLSILKTGKAKAVRFSTLEAICRELDCQPGDILEFRDEKPVIIHWQYIISCNTKWKISKFINPFGNSTSDLR